MKNFNNMLRISSIALVLKQISWYYFSDVPVSIRRDAIRQLVVLLKTLTKSRGLAFATQYLKGCRGAVTKYLCDEPLKCQGRISLKDGFPTRLSSLRILVDTGLPQYLKFAMTLLQVSRALRPLVTEIDYSTITDPEIENVLRLPKDFIKKFIETFGLVAYSHTQTYESFFLNQKAGPVGLAILTSWTSFWTGNPTWQSGLIGTKSLLWLQTLSRESGGRANEVNWVSKKIPTNTRRLSFVNETEGKTRVVAIFDYITQVSLDAISKDIFACLRSIPMDRTFTQNPILERDGDNHFYSIDLKAFTDRFPMSAQYDLLCEQISPIIAHTWRKVLVEQPFLTPDGKSVFYKAGQPMGARSSWAVCSLTHHLVVQYSAFLIGKFPFNGYILLGDDIVINNDSVAESYKTVLTAQGVTIQLTKSHKSLTTYEFAKRWYRDGTEITGVPIKGFVENTKKPFEVFSQILSLRDRGYTSPSFISPLDLIFKWQKAIRYPFKQLKRTMNQLRSLWFIERLTRNFNYDIARQFVAEATSKNLYMIPADEVGLKRELSRVLSALVSQKVMDLSYTLKNYLMMIPSVLGKDIEVVGDFSSHPFSLALLNALEELRKLASATVSIDNQEDIVKKLTLLDQESIAPGKKTKEERVLWLANLGSKLRNQFRDYPEDEAAKAHHMTLKADIFKLLRERKTEERMLEAEDAKRLADAATFQSSLYDMVDPKLLKKQPGVFHIKQTRKKD